MLDKKDIVNFLYVISFPVYGIGAYVAAAFSPTIGYVTGIVIHILIIIFYLIDVLYTKEVRIKINGLPILMLLFLTSSIAALFIGASKMPQLAGSTIAYGKSAVLLVTFFAFLIVCLYNKKQFEKLAKLTFVSWSLLLLINLIGFYGLGLSNETHSIKGRVNLPFIDGLYSGACLLAILNLMLLYYMKKSIKDPIRLSYLFVYFSVNLVLLFLINSRLTNMVFLLVFILYFLNLIGKIKGLFTVIVFTIPILLNIGILIYKILSLPFFVFIMKRVSVIDVTTFNGRAFAWESAMDWALYDQRGIIFGNGYGGQYFLHLMKRVADLWNVNESTTHLHSSTLTILVDQGIVGFTLLTIIIFRVYSYYKKKFNTGNADGIFFPVVVFTYAVMQVDMFGSQDALGGAILAFLVATVSVNQKHALKTVK